jgi:hypothetical protein
MSDLVPYIDGTGKYLGSFDATNAPKGAVAVMAGGLTDGAGTWNGAAWVYPQPAVPPDLSDSANLPKMIKAAVLTAAQLSGKTPAQASAAFKAVWNALPILLLLLAGDASADMMLMGAGSGGETSHILASAGSCLLAAAGSCLLVQ